MRVQSIPTKSRKFLGFFVTSIITLLSFFTLFILVFPSAGGGRVPPPPSGYVPAAGHINSVESHYSMIPALYAQNGQWINAKNAGVI